MGIIIADLVEKSFLIKHKILHGGWEVSVIGEAFETFRGCATSLTNDETTTNIQDTSDQPATTLAPTEEVKPAQSTDTFAQLPDECYPLAKAKHAAFKENNKIIRAFYNYMEEQGRPLGDEFDKLPINQKYDMMFDIIDERTKLEMADDPTLDEGAIKRAIQDERDVFVEFLNIPRWASDPRLK
jgi:hypothetical protein